MDIKKDHPKQVDIKRLDALYQGFFEYKQLTLIHSLYQKRPNTSITYSSELKREVMCRGDAVAVLLYNLELQEILLVEQIRAGAVASIQNKSMHSGQEAEFQQAWLLEPVAGGIDDGESPENAVHREAMEEAGVSINNLEFIVEYYPSPAGCDERILLYAAEYDANTDIQYAGLDHEHEDIKVVRLSFDEAKRKLRRHEFNVSTTIMTLQWFFCQKLTNH